MLGNKVAKNSLWLISGKVIQMLVSLIIGLITTRYLGPSNYGLLSYATAYTTFFASLCTLGINSVLVKELIEHPDENGAILGSSIIMRVASSLLSAVAILGIVSIVDKNEPLTITVVALCSLGMIFQVFDIFNYWFQSKLMSKVTAKVSLIAYVVVALYKVVLLMLGKDVAFFAFATALDYICIGVLLFFFYKKHGGDRLRCSIPVCKRILSQSCYFIIPGLMVAIYSQTDRLMLKQYFSETTVGYYSTAVTICGLWVFVLSAIVDSFYPTIMEASKSNDENEFERKNKLLYAIVFYISIFVSTFITLLAKPIIYILYGSAYLPGVNALRIITWYTAFSYLGVARDAWIVCKKRQKYLIWIYVSAAIANVVLNILLIPIWGASGAALASLAAQIITTFVVPFFIKPLRRNSMLMLEAIFFKGIKK